MLTTIDLYIYVEYGDINGVQSYLNSGGDVLHYGGIGDEGPLHHAARKNDVEISKLLLAYPLIDVDYKDDRMWTPLHLSVYHNYIDVARLLLQHKANPNLVDINGKTSLHLALRDGRYIDMVDLLLEVGAEPNVINDEGLTPLSIAAAHQQKEICILLLQRGADISLCTEKLRLSKVLSDTSQEAFEILEHNDKAILQMVGYSLALSMFRVPFEMIKEVCRYYESPYWWKKFDTENIHKLRAAVLPTYAQKLLESIPADVDMVDTEASSDEEECVACSNNDSSASQELDGFSAGSSCSSDNDNALADEGAVVISSSQRHYRTVATSANDNQNSLLLDEILEWISTLPAWFQEHMMRLHILERLMVWLDGGTIGTELTSSDRGNSFESEHVHSSRYEAAPYTTEKASAADYATEYHAQLIGDGIIDSAFYPVTMDWNSGVTL
ncbi:ankyrin repeat domain-containing protein [Rickettsiales endosymbiont of Peranema trichophorum]|uniref:ankyrin repeat domain-containing protein n=1 Tax=Rickettsiales endosymbiont of Peranema trichophorum TaxID=2486577 RepID=UPI001023C07D|nr:ankyrin repeat domain-containing protein [Rickettsiales endosymbiont of Peranema trichophorum]RZI45786.1 ankyrin repeat domain-containing protein [Rickettsiales endosymbiont of Peranema trichophorum]